MNTQAQYLLNELSKQTDIFEISRTILTLRREHEIPLKEIAKYIGKHQTYVSHVMRVQKLPAIVVDGYYAGQISATHLVILSRLDNQEDMVEAYRTILRDELTVQGVELLVRQFKYGISDDTKTMSPKELGILADRLNDLYSAKVRIVQSKVRAKISIEKRGSPEATAVFIMQVTDLLRTIAENETRVDEKRTRK